MYFSKKVQSSFFKAAGKEQYKAFEAKLFTGLFSEDENELKEIVDAMFAAWRKIVCSRSGGLVRNFDGMLRRLCFGYSEKDGGFYPYFHLIFIQDIQRLDKRLKVSCDDDEYKLKLADEKLRISVYIKWLSAWVTALKLCTDVSVDFSVLDLEALESSLSAFCTNEKYCLLGMIDEAKRQILKNACSSHRLVSFHGIFRKMMINRHVSVER